MSSVLVSLQCAYVHVNQVAGWSLSATEGYRLPRPVGTKLTHLLFIHNLKVYRTECILWSQAGHSLKIYQLCDAGHGFTLAPQGMPCNTRQERVTIAWCSTSQARLTGTHWKFEGRAYLWFLRVCKIMVQNEKWTLELMAKAYVQRMSVIWSSPSSDVKRVAASNQFALPLLTHLMWTQDWPTSKLRLIDREVRKTICKSGGKHPLSFSTVNMYLSRDKRGCGLWSVVQDCKLNKIKAVVKPRSPMRAIQMFEKKTTEKELSLLVTEANKFTEELGTSLLLCMVKDT